MSGQEAGGAVFILSASSDIGRALAERYARTGRAVVGTFRNPEAVRDLGRCAGVHLLPCDVQSRESVRSMLASYADLRLPWHLFVSSVGTMEPIGPFASVDFDAWEESVVTNSIAQLRVLQGLHRYRRRGQTCHVAFFAGGGTNNPFRNYSAYCVAKILLIKMCELLDDESSDLNVFILGPGFLPTKIHEQTMRNPDGAGDNLRRTVEFFTSAQPRASYDDIFECVNWCVAQGRDVVGGRNLSVVHDPWRNGGKELAEQLREDRDKFKLRRFRNREESSGA